MSLASASKKILKKIQSIFSLPTFYFENIALETDAALAICDMAKMAYPKECTALLVGHIEQKTLRITGILYQRYYASNHETLMQIDLPLVHGTVGTFHSHPSGIIRPSHADRLFFSKQGMVHVIIGKPYTPETIAMYDKSARPCSFRLI